jgi:hypothetical protein
MLSVTAAASWRDGLGEEVCEHAEEIYSQRAEGTVPCEASWPEDDVEPSRAWIDAGMPA